MSEPRVTPGMVLAAKYRVEKVLGTGGMGVVVAATHLALDQRVALKYMLPAAINDPDMLARFQREARAAVKLKSEHVARVLDTGAFADGSPYIVMEHLEGNDLAAELRRFGKLSAPVVAEYVLQACDAVAEAHSLGIVHRDLKPANLFLTRRHDGSPLVKVLDFGISKTTAFDDASLAMTSTASMLGSPLYMSPEQMRSSKHVDARTDVWSLGVILYELLGGRVPFNATTLGELLSQVMMDGHVPLTTVQPDVPADLSALVDRCLVKDRTQRAQNVADIARALAPYVPPRAAPLVERVANVVGARAEVPRPSGLPTMPSAAVSAAPPPPPSALGAAPSAPPSAVANTAPSWSGTRGSGTVRTSRVGWLSLGALLLVAAGTSGGIFVWSRSKPPTESKRVAAAATAEPEPTTPARSASVTPAPPEAASASISAEPSAAPPASASATPSATAAPPGKPRPRAATSTRAAPASSKPAALAAPATASPNPPVTKPGILDDSK